MDLYENFKARCDNGEAIELASQSTIGTIIDAQNCYTKAMEAKKSEKDRQWAHLTSLSSVYVLGFISGARAVRERSRTKKKT